MTSMERLGKAPFTGEVRESVKSHMEAVLSVRLYAASLRELARLLRPPDLPCAWDGDLLLPPFLDE